MLPTKTTSPVSLQKQLEITSKDEGEKCGKSWSYFLSGVPLVVNCKYHPIPQPSHMWPARGNLWAQTSEQMESNLGEGPKPPEWCAISQEEGGGRGLAQQPTQPRAWGRVSKLPALWFLSRPSLPWPDGGQERETPLLGMTAGQGMLVSARCRAGQAVQADTLFGPAQERGAICDFYPFVVDPDNPGKVGGGQVLNL